MEYLQEESEKEAEGWMLKAAKIASNATCLRAKCGCIIVKEGKIIGGGFNSPPNGLETQRRCKSEREEYHKKVTDKTCCIHAEQRAIMDALKSNPLEIKDSTLYYVGLDEKGDIARSKSPYCTHCSKLALDSGIISFVLWHEKGICAYGTEEYNILSYQYNG